MIVRLRVFMQIGRAAAITSSFHFLVILVSQQEPAQNQLESNRFLRRAINS